MLTHAFVNVRSLIETSSTVQARVGVANWHHCCNKVGHLISCWSTWTMMWSNSAPRVLRLSSDYQKRFFCFTVGFQRPSACILSRCKNCYQGIKINYCPRVWFVVFLSMNFDELSEPNRNLSRVAKLMHVTNAFIFKKTYKLSMSLLSIRFLLNAS